MIMVLDNSKVILSRLDSIKEELDYIKENMVEKEQIMSEVEFEAYARSLNKSNLVSLNDTKKILGL